MMNSWSLKEGFVFAFANKLLSNNGVDNIYEISFSEKLGSQIVRPFFSILEFVSRNIKQPLAIAIFTIIAALILTLFFYSIPVFVVFGKLFPSWLVRFFLFFSVELNLFAIGLRTFARFNNKALVNLWKKGELVAVMPGEYEIKQAL